MASPMLLFAASNSSALETIGGWPLVPDQIPGSNPWTNRRLHFTGSSSGFARFRDESLNPYPVPAGHSLCLRLQQHSTPWESDTDPILTVQDEYNVPAIALFSRNISNVQMFQIGYNPNAMSTAGAATSWNFLPNQAVISSNIGDQAISALQLNLVLDPAGNHQVELVQDDNRSLGIQSFSFSSFNPSAHLIGFGIVNPDHNEWDVSQLMARMDGDLTGAHVLSMTQVSPGHHADWQGQMSDVSEIPDNTSTFNSATASGARQSYQMNAQQQLPSGYVLDSMWHYLTARDAAASPRNLISSYEQGSFDVQASAPMTGTMQASFSTLTQRYNTNPATGMAWVPQDLASPPAFGWGIQ